MSDYHLPHRGQLPRSQRGYTLVEILIALVVGLFLVGGLMTITQGSRRTSNNQVLLAQLQDNQRFAMSLLNDVIQTAGYFTDPTLNTALTALPAAGAAFASAGQPFSGTHAAAAPGDTVIARYMTAANDTIINCSGGSNTGPGTALYTNQFSVSATGTLQCSLNGGATEIPIVTGVNNLQVLYGVNTAGSTTTHDVDTYLNASQMTALDWLNVTSVQVTLTFVNPLCAAPLPCQAGQQPTIPFTRVIAVMSRTGVTT